MAISEKEREAYEAGRREAKDQEAPLRYLFSTSNRPSDPDSSIQEAFNKGLCGEQFDGDKETNDRCFLTTACIEYAGLPDDCYELQTMRKFRDEYIRTLSEADGLLEEYYRVAPMIVGRIKSRSDSNHVFYKLLANLREAISLIQTGQNSEALVLCKKEFNILKEKYSSVST